MLVLNACVHVPPPSPSLVDFVIQLPLSIFFFLTLVEIFLVQLLLFDLFFASAAFTYNTFPSEGYLLWHLQFSNIFRFVRKWKELFKKKVT